MGNGHWAMGIGQWAMGNGQWAMGIGNNSFTFPLSPFPFPPLQSDMRSLTGAIAQPLQYSNTLMKLKFTFQMAKMGTNS
ncbi:hypothetical protein H6G81_11725 [Scytonema hofmannii FACHB-248]|uniref:Uncharacterized protein n=2 Tax=Nostocales TaxID=1161 RepID=A0ABR8GPU8_9CYAN|nr:hypothetical protein [Scytonema hofmannii]MBD2605183.1 hypothetical protein [Scytonema hofmannii FACHB-248]